MNDNEKEALFHIFAGMIGGAVVYLYIIIFVTLLEVIAKWKNTAFILWCGETAKFKRFYTTGQTLKEAAKNANAPEMMEKINEAMRRNGKHLAAAFEKAISELKGGAAWSFWQSYFFRFIF